MNLSESINSAKTFLELDKVLQTAKPEYSKSCLWEGRYITSTKYSGWERFTKVFTKTMELNKKADHENPSKEDIEGAWRLLKTIDRLVHESAKQGKPNPKDPIYKWYISPSTETEDSVGSFEYTWYPNREEVQDLENQHPECKNEIKEYHKLIKDFYKDKSPGVVYVWETKVEKSLPREHVVTRRSMRNVKNP